MHPMLASSCRFVLRFFTKRTTSCITANKSKHPATGNTKRNDLLDPETTIMGISTEQISSITAYFAHVRIEDVTTKKQMLIRPIINIVLYWL